MSSGYISKILNQVAFKKMLPSMLKVVMAETICADERCFPKGLLAFCVWLFFGWLFVCVFLGGGGGLLVVFFISQFHPF